MNTSEFNLNLAVVIGINDYQNNISQLATARQDAEAIAHLLETKYQYQVILITDTTEIKPTFEQLHHFFEQDLPDRIQSPESTRLIFYFAGHGIAEGSDRGPAGYLIPQNAKLGDTKTYLSMQTIHDTLCQLSCHHLLVILDCCFGGAFRWANSRHLAFLDSEKVYKQHYEYFTHFPAWQVITSAAHDQTALDLSIDRRQGDTDEKNQHSPFAAALLEGLQTSEADLIQDRVITTHELYVYLQDRLTRLFGNQQTPGLWPLKPDYDRGEFIFTSLDFDQDTLENAPPIDTRSNPYRGLKSFEERHADLFFGRDMLIAQLVDRVSNNVTPPLPQGTLQHPLQKLLIVLGISGSGKSSLVKAGLLPKLRHHTQQKWYVLTPMRPSNAPFMSLAQVIFPIVNDQSLQKLKDFQFLDHHFTERLENKSHQSLGPDFVSLADSWLKATPESKLIIIIDRLNDLQKVCSDLESSQLTTFKIAIDDEIKTLEQNLQETPQYLADIVQAWSEKNSSTSLMLVIDQMEELVTMMPSTQNVVSRTNYQTQIDKIRQSQWWIFLETLKISLERAYIPLYIVLTLRSDFEPRFYKTPLEDYWKEACFYIDDMTSEELRLAIEKPALKQAIYFEPPELVSRLIDDVRKMPGALPLLSFTLSELHRTLQERWRIEKTTDRALREADYETLGGVTKSLANRGTQVYEDLTQDVSKAEGERLQGLMRQILRRMISLEGGGTRRRALKSELDYPNDHDNQVISNILQRLVDCRLVVAGQDAGETYYEPAHDSLVVNWMQPEWMTSQAKEELALQRLLTPAAREWQEWDLQKHEKQRSQWDLIIHSVGRPWQIINHLWDRWEFNEVAQLQQKIQVKEQQQVKSENFLWNANPRLTLLKMIFFSGFNNWLNQTEYKFVDKSIRKQRKNIFLRWSGVISGATILTLLTTVSIIGQYNSLAREIEASRMAAESNLLAHQDLDALVSGIQASQPLKNPLLKVLPPDQTLQNRLKGTLSKALYRLQEVNRLEGHNYDVWNASFMPNGQHLVSAGYDGKLRIWSLNGELLSESHEQHKTFIRSLAISSDGLTVATGDGAGIIYLWKIEYNKAIYIDQFKASQKTIRSLSFHPQYSNVLVSASYDGWVKAWDLKQMPIKSESVQISNSQPQILFETYNDTLIYDASFSSDSKSLATVGNDNTIRIYDVSKFLSNIVKSDKSIQSIGKCLYLPTEKGNTTSYIRSIQFNPKNRHQLLTSRRDGSARLWDLEDGKNETQPLTCREAGGKNGKNELSKAPLIQISEKSGLWSAKFSPNGNQIITTGDNGIARLWDLNGKLLHNFSGHNGTIYNVDFHPDGDQLVTAGEDGTIRLWKWSQDSEYVKSFETDFIGSRKIKFSSNQSVSKYIAIAGSSGGFQVWQMDKSFNLNKKVCEQTYKGTGHSGLILSLDFSTDGEFLAIGGEDGKVSLWNLSGKCTKQAEHEIIPENDPALKNPSNNVNSIQFSPTNSNFLAAAIGNGTVQLWKLGNLKNNQIKEGLAHSLFFQAHQGSALNLTFSPNSELLVTTGNDSSVRIWDNNKLQIALANSQNTKKILDENLRKTVLLKECLGHQSWVEGVSFHPDGNILATSDSGGTILLWNIKQGKCEPIRLEKLIRRSPGNIYGLTFSPDGHMLAVGNADGTVRVWDLGGNLVHEFPGHTGKIYSVAFSPDSKVLAVTDSSKTVRLWKIQELDKLLAQSCERVRNYLKYNPNAKDIRNICDGIGTELK